MSKLRLDEVRDVLPELDELRPLFDHLLSTSEPDGARSWSGSGRLGTVGSRLVRLDSLATEVDDLVAAQGKRLSAVYEAVGRALAALAAEDGASAALAFLDAAALEEASDRPERAQAYADAAYLAARDVRDRRPAALALRRSARAARARGALESAIASYAESHRVALAMRDAAGAAEAAIGAGNALEERGRWSEAADWYRRALAAVDELQEPLPERWHAFLNLHIVTRSSGAIEESVDWLERAEEEAGRVDADGAAPYVANARGQLAMARGAHGEAERELKSAVAASTNARARVGFRLNLAEALLAQGRNLDAAEHAREAEREAIRAGVVPKLPEVYRLLGRIASADGDADAFVLFERALEIIRERALPKLEEALTLQAYAEAEAARGDAETSEQLRARAKEQFSMLGMSHMRRPWADVYTAASDALPQNRDQRRGS